MHDEGIDAAERGVVEVAATADALVVERREGVVHVGDMDRRLELAVGVGDGGAGVAKLFGQQLVNRSEKLVGLDLGDGRPLARRHLQRIAISVPEVVALRAFVVAIEDGLLPVGQEFHFVPFAIRRQVAHHPFGKWRVGAEWNETFGSQPGADQQLTSTVVAFADKALASVDGFGMPDIEVEAGMICGARAGAQPVAVAFP